MNDNDKKLYIPVNVLETKDIIPGIGGKELAAIGITTAVGVIISIIVYAVNNNMRGWRLSASWTSRLLLSSAVTTLIPMPAYWRSTMLPDRKSTRLNSSHRT